MNIRHIIPVLLAAAVATLTAHAQSDAAPHVLTLEQCISIAIADNPGLRAANLSVEKAHDMQGASLDLPPTAITLSQDATGGGGPENGINFSQDFEFPTVYVAKHKALKAETELERIKSQATANDLVRDVTSTYHSMLYARQIVRIREMQDSVYSAFLSYASARYAAGETSRLEEINASQMLSQNRIELANARDEYKARQADMQRLLNTDSPIVPADTTLAVMDAPALGIDFSSTPQGLLAAGEVAVNERNLTVARQAFLPGFTVGATTQAVISGFNPYGVDRQRFDKGNFMSFEVGITLPLFFGAQRAKAKAARRDVEIARANQLQTQLDTDNTLKSYLAQLATARQTLDYYIAEGLPQADEISRLSSASYRLGEIGYAEYIQNIETSARIRTNYAAAVNTYNQTVISINHLQGTL